jgi:hypothetical protein
MISSVDIEDLSQSVAEPRAQIERQRARIAASRGIDILSCTSACWPVCSLCNLPTVAIGVSVCCYGPVRIQGWVL